MNLALLIRGPIRPNHQSALELIRAFRECFCGHKITQYLYAWDSDEARKLVDVLTPDNVLLVEEPSDNYIMSIIHEPFKITNYIRCFKQYWSMKRATEWVNKDHDFVVQFRADSILKITTSKIPSWLDLQHYSTIHTCHDGDFTNDQVGVASPEVMRKAWDYRDENILEEFMKLANCPENVLDNIIKMNGVKLKKCDLEVWALHPDRHKLS